MSERTILLVELVKELHGPRNGPGEVLAADEDPRDEYIVGAVIWTLPHIRNRHSR